MNAAGVLIEGLQQEIKGLKLEKVALEAQIEGNRAQTRAHEQLVADLKTAHRVLMGHIGDLTRENSALLLDKQSLEGMPDDQLLKFWDNLNNPDICDGCLRRREVHKDPEDKCPYGEIERLRARLEAVKPTSWLYKVKSGDTLSEICLAVLTLTRLAPNNGDLNSAIEEVARDNELEDPNLIREGSLLELKSILP